MPALGFAKYHGLGNDFIVVDARTSTSWPTSRLAQRLCDRRRGIGADGVLTMLPPRSGDADWRMHLFNADGSIAEMCGNGLRCVVHLALAARIGAHARVDTDAGLREGWIQAGGRVRVSLGVAKLIDAKIDADVAGQGRRDAIGVSMGNPHLVLRPFERGTNLRALAAVAGPPLERHPRFPDRVNVELVEALRDDELRVVVFERGAGITDACGTGAGASVVAAQRFGAIPVRERVTVILPGGPLEVRLEGDPTRANDPGAELARVEIIGDANHVFDGTVGVAEDELQAVRAVAKI